jgi:hypothetical protein
MKISILLLIRKSPFIFLLTAVWSCSGYTTGARRQDLLNRCFVKTEIEATSNQKFGGDRLILRRNNTFRYSTDVIGINTDYYTGSYQRFGDTLVFSFSKDNRFYFSGKKDTLAMGYIRNDRPAFFSKNDTLILTQSNYNNQRQDVLSNKNGSYLTIVQNRPRNKKQLR